LVLLIMPRKRDWSIYTAVKHEEEGIVAGARRDVAEKLRWKFEPGKVLVAKRLGGAHIEEKSFVAALLWMTARGGFWAAAPGWEKRWQSHRTPRVLGGPAFRGWRNVWRIGIQSRTLGGEAQRKECGARKINGVR
jgi:hypothetical protein